MLSEIATERARDNVGIGHLFSYLITVSLVA